MNIQHSTPATPLRARMIADMTARNLGRASQASHLRACKRFAAWLKRSPDAATPDDVRGFQQYLIESGVSICTRNQTMTGVKFLFRVTLRRHDLVAEIFHLREPNRVPQVLSQKEIKRILAMTPSLKAKRVSHIDPSTSLKAIMRSKPTAKRTVNPARIKNGI